MLDTITGRIVAVKMLIPEAFYQASPEANNQLTVNLSTIAFMGRPDERVDDSLLFQLGSRPESLLDANQKRALAEPLPESCLRARHWLRHNRRSTAASLVVRVVAWAPPAQLSGPALRLSSIGSDPLVRDPTSAGRVACSGYLALEMIGQGRTLMDILNLYGDRDRRMGTEMARRCFVQVAIAVCETHAAGVAHRDIKAENVLVAGFDDDGTPRLRLGDFGCSIHASQCLVDATTPIPPARQRLVRQSTASSPIPGTISDDSCREQPSAEHSPGSVLSSASISSPPTRPIYERPVRSRHRDSRPTPRTDTRPGTFMAAAPELIQGMAANPWRADMWALGVLLYMLTTNHFPFGSASTDRNYARICEASPLWTYPEPDGGSSPMEPELVDLLQQLLRPCDSERLSIDELLQHPWVQAPSTQVVLMPCPVVVYTKLQRPR